MELATGIKFDGEFYEEGTPLNKLPSEVQKLAKEQGIVKVSVKAMQDFEEVYDKAVELGLISIDRDQLATEVQSASGTKANEMAEAEAQLEKSSTKKSAAGDTAAEETSTSTEPKTAPAGTSAAKSTASTTKSTK